MYTNQYPLSVVRGGNVLSRHRNLDAARASLARAARASKGIQIDLFDRGKHLECVMIIPASAEKGVGQ
jgi:hypothetical protein